MNNLFRSFELISTSTHSWTKRFLFTWDLYSKKLDLPIPQCRVISVLHWRHCLQRPEQQVRPVPDTWFLPLSKNLSQGFPGPRPYPRFTFPRSNTSRRVGSATPSPRSHGCVLRITYFHTRFRKTCDITSNNFRCFKNCIKVVRRMSHHGASLPRCFGVRR